MLLKVRLYDLVHHVNIIHGIIGGAVRRYEKLINGDLVQMSANSSRQIRLAHGASVCCASSSQELQKEFVGDGV